MDISPLPITPAKTPGAITPKSDCKTPKSVLKRKTPSSKCETPNIKRKKLNVRRKVHFDLQLLSMNIEYQSNQIPIRQISQSHKHKYLYKMTDDEKCHKSN